MCEEMGWEPDLTQEPMDVGDLINDFQYSILLYNILPDKIEGMNGVWMGKEFAGLMDIMELYDIPNKRLTFEGLLLCIGEASKFYEQQRKLNEHRK